MDNEVQGPGFGFTKAFLNSTITKGILDGVVMHSYNNDGGEYWQRPGFLSQTLVQAENMLQESRKHSATVPLWCGECGPHNQGTPVLWAASAVDEEPQTPTALCLDCG